MILIKCVKKPTCISLETMQSVLSHLPIEKQNKIRRYIRIDDQYRSLIAQLLMRICINEYSGCTLSKMEFISDSHGKPFLSGFNDIYFNISHSGEWIVCAVDVRPIGIDVEYIHDISLHIAQRFFSLSESKQLFLQSPGSQLDYFYKLWTLKESYIKAIGVGLSKPLSSFSIHISYERITIDDTENSNAHTQYRFELISLDGAHQSAVCYQSLNTLKSFTIISFESLVHRFTSLL